MKIVGIGQFSPLGGEYITFICVLPVFASASAVIIHSGSSLAVAHAERLDESRPVGVMVHAVCSLQSYLSKRIAYLSDYVCMHLSVGS